MRPLFNVFSSLLPLQASIGAKTVPGVAFLVGFCNYQHTYIKAMAPVVLKYTKVVPQAFPPTKGSVKAAGFDLKSAEDTVVPARGKALVDTGLKIELPEGCYGRIAPRSGLAVKSFIDVGGEYSIPLIMVWKKKIVSAGVVDEDYRGVLKVVLFNHSNSDFEVKQGDRIAQLICERIYYPELQEVEVIAIFLTLWFPLILYSFRSCQTLSVERVASVLPALIKFLL